MASVAAAIEILGRLVAFDTTSHKTNVPCAEYIRDYLAGHGIASHLLPSDDGVHASLFASIGPGFGAEAGSAGAADAPPAGGGIALSGHMDVVPVTGQPWDTDPFQMTERGGRLYGRGTCDMKGYLACVLAVAPELKARRLTQPIHIAFSYDEEVGCTGVKPMIDAFGRTLPKPAIVLVGEPSTMTVVDAHKGGFRYRTEVFGKDAHSSKPRLGVGAIMIAAELIGELGRIEERYKAKYPSPRFDPPYASITVSSIEGGIAHNIIPPKCVFSWGVRAIPGLDTRLIEHELRRFAERELLPRMRAVHPECAITTTLMGELPPFASGEGSAATSLALQLAGQNETFAVSYGTEASHFQAAGCSSVICGPGHIDQAHQPNEYIEIAELAKCLGFLDRLGDWAAA